MTNEERIQEALGGVEREIGDILKPQEVRQRPFVAFTRDDAPEPAEPAAGASEAAEQALQRSSSVAEEVGLSPTEPELSVTERLKLLAEQVHLLHAYIAARADAIDAKLDLILTTLK